MRSGRLSAIVVATLAVLSFGVGMPKASAVDTSWHQDGSDCKQLTSNITACVWLEYRIDPDLVPSESYYQVRAVGQMYDSNPNTYLSIPIVYTDKFNPLTQSWSQGATNSNAQVGSGYTEVTTKDGIVMCSEQYRTWRPDVHFHWDSVTNPPQNQVVKGSDYTFPEHNCYPTPL